MTNAEKIKAALEDEEFAAIIEDDILAGPFAQSEQTLAESMKILASGEK